LRAENGHGLRIPKLHPDFDPPLVEVFFVAGDAQLDLPQAAHFLERRRELDVEVPHDLRELRFPPQQHRVHALLLGGVLFLFVGKGSGFVLHFRLEVPVRDVYFGITDHAVEVRLETVHLPLDLDQSLVRVHHHVPYGSVVPVFVRDGVPFGQVHFHGLIAFFFRIELCLWAGQRKAGRIEHTNGEKKERVELDSQRTVGSR
jgi:hypothetical protein